MPPTGCMNGLVVMVLVAVLFLPVQYYVPDMYAPEPETEVNHPAPVYTFAWPETADLPIFDTIIALAFVSCMFVIYICDWIQRKLLERRLLKLNQELKVSMDSLRDYDERQEQIEKMLYTVQKATVEYNLLLYLLLKKHGLMPLEDPPDNCFLDKELEFPYESNAIDL